MEELNFDKLEHIISPWFEEAFKSLKRNQAAVFDELSSNLIIDTHSLKTIAFHVFKVSIRQGIFPDSLKNVEVTPTFKSGDKDNISNYRVISILPVFSKVLERLCIIIYNHVDFKSLLYEKQFVFQRNNSTEHAIPQLTRDTTSSFEKGEYTFGVLLDLSKVFDIADHQILIKMLQYHGIDGPA